MQASHRNDSYTLILPAVNNDYILCIVNACACSVIAGTDFCRTLYVVHALPYIFDIFKFSPETPFSYVKLGEKDDGVIGELVQTTVLELDPNYGSILTQILRKSWYLNFGDGFWFSYPKTPLTVISVKVENFWNVAFVTRGLLVSVKDDLYIGNILYTYVLIHYILSILASLFISVFELLSLGSFFIVGPIYTLKCRALSIALGLVYSWRGPGCKPLHSWPHIQHSAKHSSIQLKNHLSCRR